MTPKVVARDPQWLSRPSPGFQFFSHDTHPVLHTPRRHHGAHRKIAHRGTEVFVALGHELRWSDLSILREAGESFERGRGVGEGFGAEETEGGREYRVLRTPVAREIQQIGVSPSGDFIVICTSHTVHVAILPSSTHLRSGDLSPLKLKAFQVGPTAHVLEQSPVASALWHPLSPTGNCLVTVTKDACVRLWELDRENRSTFDEPGLAVDLKKLANAASMQEDLTASKYGTNKGFSPDSAMMEVASACFGGQGGADELGWASMTMWFAMSEGDVYALCPFLPERWVAPRWLLPSLSTSVVSKAKAIGSDGQATEDERRQADQQCKWLADVDAQDPIIQTIDDEFGQEEVYRRPERPSAVAKLQGPFYVGSEMDIGEITDIFVIPPKINEEALFDEEEELEADEGLSIGIVCIATSTSKIHICLDLDGVEAEWLPNRRARSYGLDDLDDKDLLLFETIDLSDPDFESASHYPTFTASPMERYEVFVTTPSVVYSLDFKLWANRLEEELIAEDEKGIDFRIDILAGSATSTVARMIEIPNEPEQGINAVIAIYDPANLGYLLLTTAMNTPHSAILQIPSANRFAPDTIAPAIAALPAPEPRASYQPADDFYARSALPDLIKTANEKKVLGSDLKQSVRFSSSTLALMTDAHRILSSETHKLGLAAADLFRRCERMRSELLEQVRRVQEISQKVDAVIGEDERLENYEGDEGDDDEVLRGKEKIETRVNESHEKTVELSERVERLRKKMLKLGGRELSLKERAFADEVQAVHAQIEPAAPDAPTDPPSILSLDNSAGDLEQYKAEKSGDLADRFEAVVGLHQKLVRQAEVGGVAHAGVKVGVGGGGGEYRKRQLAQVMALLERETALVEGVSERLRRLAGG
ncbi:hypothetical protein Tdes44962_MAKER06620 [Teratosphaeria destructans]|uniref:Nuclear pore complex protein An-Nup82 n=1 Tax=Teratosphaeria destructans TaxID=418781 RepID=A0A9W7T172_9PEZI|nr:hypothetical protein Tdes44962_MAKER06620 [Teratosphaeria destructans]